MQKLSANSNSERSSIITMLAIIYYAPLPYKIHTSITIYIVSIVPVQNSAVHTVHTYTHQHSTHSCIRINIIQYRTRTSDIIKIRVVVQNRIELNQSSASQAKPSQSINQSINQHCHCHCHYGVDSDWSESQFRRRNTKRKRNKRKHDHQCHHQ